MDRARASSLARDLMNQYGLGQWTFEFDRALRRAGCCYHGQKRISLSYHYVDLNSEEDIKDTILHEIAHGLAGHGVGHGWQWKRICVTIGAKPERCCSDVDMPKGKYKAICGGCSTTFHQHRMRQSIGYKYCRKCGPDVGRLTFKE